MLNDYWGLIGGVNTVVFLDFNTAYDRSGPPFSYVINLQNGTNIRSATECVAASGPCTTVSRTTTSPNVFNVFSSSYTNNTGSGLYAGTTGTVNLDPLAFSVFPNEQSDWLAAIRIVSTGGGFNVGRAALTAITLETATVPEPTTVLMLLGGLGVLGYARKRSGKIA